MSASIAPCKKKGLEREVEGYRLHLEEMVAERTHQIEAALKLVERSYQDTLEALGAAIDLRDAATEGHSRRVCRFALEIAKVMGLSESQHKSIAMGAYLHNIGKLALPDGILLKPGPLTNEERVFMQRHVQVGYDLVKQIPFLAAAAELIRTLPSLPTVLTVAPSPSRKDSESFTQSQDASSIRKSPAHSSASLRKPGPRSPGISMKSLLFRLGCAAAALSPRSLHMSPVGGANYLRLPPPQSQATPSVSTSAGPPVLLPHTQFLS